ncbi:MAG: phosphate ABC transporter substrate-binding protein PstS [Candidatus Binataceae bacterium]
MDGASRLATGGRRERCDGTTRASIWFWSARESFVVLGADVITYNLPPLTEPLRFTGPAVADIFLGKITKWNDQAIAELNPNAKLPDIPIVVCHRSDGSGTTFVFADYLSKVSPEWASKVGKGASVSWPVGFGGNGNQGVTELVKQTSGAIGYVELAYAVENHLPASRLKNHDGNWVEANTKTVTSAAASAAASMPSDFRVSITDAPGADSYPISSFTYLLIYEQQKDGAKGKALVAFIEWMLHDGQNFTIPLSYSPLPGSVIAAEEKQLKMIELAPQ